MNRIKEWLEQDPKRMHFIKIGLVLLGIILLIALPSLYLVLSGVGIWYFVKKSPDIRKRNLMIGLFIVSFVAVTLQTPTVTKKILSSQSETKQTAATTASTSSTTDSSSSIEAAKRVEEEKKAKEKEEEKRIAREAENKAQQQDRIVYVANHGNAKVYWYSKDRMPPKTNKANVVEMTEADAIAAGKRPSKTE